MIMQKRRSTYNIQPLVGEYFPEYCQDVTQFVKRFVHSSVIAAIKIITMMDKQSHSEHPTVAQLHDYNETKWPTCGNINVRNGLQCVEKEMDKWSQLPAMKYWMYHIQFIGLETQRTNEFYTYRVLWSIPTPAYPEPYVTISVFFCITASRVWPPYFPVDVSYVFEGNQFVHGLDIIFRPKWLYDILDMKTMLFRTFTF